MLSLVYEYDDPSLKPSQKVPKPHKILNVKKQRCWQQTVHGTK